MALALLASVLHCMFSFTCLQVKLRCSLTWLHGIISESSSLQLFQAKKPHKSFKNVLLNPYHHQNLKKDLIDLLTDPNVYASTYCVIFPREKIETGSFEILIHNLAKRGGYVLEDDDTVVNSSMLAQKDPFRKVSV